MLIKLVSLQLNPNNRIGADDALHHKFFASLPQKLYDLPDGEYRTKTFYFFHLPGESLYNLSHLKLNFDDHTVLCVNITHVVSPGALNLISADVQSNLTFQYHLYHGGFVPCIVSYSLYF